MPRAMLYVACRASCCHVPSPQPLGTATTGTRRRRGACGAVRCPSCTIGGDGSRADRRHTTDNVQATIQRATFQDAIRSVQHCKTQDATLRHAAARPCQPVTRLAARRSRSPSSRSPREPCSRPARAHGTSARSPCAAECHAARELSLPSPLVPFSRSLYAMHACYACMHVRAGARVCAPCVPCRRRGSAPVAPDGQEC